MKRKKHIFTLILSLLILLSVYFCYEYESIFARINNIKESIVVTIADSGLPPVTSVNNTNPVVTLPDDTKTISENITANSKLLPVNNIMQLPELPTGCEITSLTIVLNYLGFDVDKEYMASKYLEQAKPFESSFRDNFIGSPWDQHSYGCFSPVIVKSANHFLLDSDSSLKVYDISGSTMQELCAQVQSGNPVIVWASRLLDEKTTKTPIRLDNGTIDYWYSNEHCMVLIGYDLQKGTVTLCDPLEGIVERDFNTFAARYEEFQRMGVIIK